MTTKGSKQVRKSPAFAQGRITEASWKAVAEPWAAALRANEGVVWRAIGPIEFGSGSPFPGDILMEIRELLIRDPSEQRGEDTFVASVLWVPVSESWPSSPA